MSFAHFGHSPNFGHSTKQIRGNQSRITSHRHRKRGSHIHPGYEFSRKLGNYRAQKGMEKQEPLVEPPEKAPKKAPPEPQDIRVAKPAPKETARETEPQTRKEAPTIKKFGEVYGWGDVLAWTGEFIPLSSSILFVSLDYKELYDIYLSANEVKNPEEKGRIMTRLGELGLMAPVKHEKLRECIKKIEKARKEGAFTAFTAEKGEHPSLYRAWSIISKNMILKFAAELESQGVFEEPQKSEVAF